jgi:small subunit ribosomal protein S6
LLLLKRGFTSIRRFKMLNDYESVFIIRPSLTEEEAGGLTDKIKGIIEKNGGQIVKVENWGKKKLAYEAKKEKKGIYVLLHFQGQGNLVAELERNFKIQDSIIKYQTVKLNMKEEESKARRIGMLVEAQREKALEPISHRES